MLFIAFSSVSYSRYKETKSLLNKSSCKAQNNDGTIFESLMLQFVDAAKVSK
jgi:hypothetical protein